MNEDQPTKTNSPDRSNSEGDDDLSSPPPPAHEEPNATTTGNKADPDAMRDGDAAKKKMQIGRSKQKMIKCSPGIYSSMLQQEKQNVAYPMVHKQKQLPFTSGSGGETAALGQEPKRDPTLPNKTSCDENPSHISYLDGEKDPPNHNNETRSYMPYLEEEEEEEDNRSGNCQRRAGAPPTQPGAFYSAPGINLQSPPNLIEEVQHDEEEEEVEDSTGNHGEGRILDHANHYDHQGAPPNNVASDDGLVEALPVESNHHASDMMMMEAQPVDNRDLEYRQRAIRQEVKDKKCMILTCVFVAVAILILTLSLVLVFGLKKTKTESEVVPDDDDHPSPSPSEAPTSLGDYVTSLLPDDTLVALEDPESPQSLAYNWLMEDPYGKTYSTDRIIQRFCLGVFFYATGGPDWRNNTSWMSYESHECSWYAADTAKTLLQSGILSSSTPLYVDLVISHMNESSPCQDPENNQAYTHLLLMMNNLKGTLPRELYMLTSLRGLILAPNPSLTGPGIPTDIGILSSLETLVMTGGQFTGTIASEIALLPRLRTVSFGYTQLAGSLPSELGLLSNSLEFLDLFKNQLTGTIPTEVGSLTKVALFNVHQNDNIFGSLPSELGKMQSLSWVSLSRDNLEGRIPSQLGMLKSLEELFIYSNSLTGSVPTQLTSLVTNGNLRLLHVYDNILSGSIPEGLCLIETISESIPDLKNQSLVGCHCNCTFIYDEEQGNQLCSPLPHRCSQ